MKMAAKNILEKFGLLNSTRRMLNPARRLRRRISHPFKPSDRTIVARYLAQTSVPKLHVGCGGHVLCGWLNTDYDSKLPIVMHLDTRQHFPFKDETFNYIFCEHVIEHMSYWDGVKMLTECFRILKRFGKIRISTPDLAFLIDLTRPDKSDLQRAYIKWAANTFIPGTPDDNEVFVINNFVRDWGHTFIYDENTLRGAMTNAGFKTITKFDQHESNDAALRNLENEKHLPPGFLRLESFTLEGSK
jgi:predicted SAM-dependent methyltransferase